MGSRVRENVKHLIECFCEVVAPHGPDQAPWVIQKFPESFKDTEVLRSVPQFAFPCEFENKSVQHFSFVLTDIDSKWTFGFCRHASQAETALVVLSHLPWHETFYKLLNHISELIYGKDAGEVWKFLDAVYKSDIPEPGTVLHVPYNEGKNTFLCQCPNQFALPSIPENRNLTEYFNAVDAHNMMVIFASMLYERRIIITSRRLSRLSACVQAANAVIYPMNWQHIFIPVLPMHLIDYLSAPMPFLIGVPQPIMQRVKRSELGEVVVLDADNNKIETAFDDLSTLPPEVVSALKRRLKNPNNMLGDGVARSFLRSLVQLIGGYRDALKFRQGEKITFSKDAFLQSRPSSIQSFLQKMLELQIFQQFIEERLDMLNSGQGFSDEFELEACLYSDKSSSKLKQQYREWMSTIRKDGGAFIKSVKSRANPAVKQAVKSVKAGGKSVKERGRNAYKDIRHKLKELQTREFIDSHDVIEAVRPSDDSDTGDKPRSAPSSPTLKQRPNTILGRSPVKAAATYVKDHRDRRNSAESDIKSKQYNIMDSSSASESPEHGTDIDSPSFQMPVLDMDLMGDLQDVIFRKCSLPRSASGSSSSGEKVTLTNGEGGLKSPASPWVANPEAVTKIKLPAPTPPPRRRKKAGPGNQASVASDSTKEEKRKTDLIQLDSTPSDDDFDPLFTKEKYGSNNISTNSVNIPVPKRISPSVTQKNIQSNIAQPMGTKPVQYQQFSAYFPQAQTVVHSVSNSGIQTNPIYPYHVPPISQQTSSQNNSSKIRMSQPNLLLSSNVNMVPKSNVTSPFQNTPNDTNPFRNHNVGMYVDFTPSGKAPSPVSASSLTATSSCASGVTPVRNPSVPGNVTSDSQATKQHTSLASFAASMLTDDQTLWKQDTDLLKEYGIDFSHTSVIPGNSHVQSSDIGLFDNGATSTSYNDPGFTSGENKANGILQPKVINETKMETKDPFADLVLFPSSAETKKSPTRPPRSLSPKQNPKAKWTTFE